MKVTVYWLTTDQHNCGTETVLFGTLAELRTALISYIEERAKEVLETYTDEGDEPWRAAAQRALDLLAKGIVISEDPGYDEEGESAWDVFMEGPGADWKHELKNSDDYYWWGEEEIEVPSLNFITEAEEAWL